MEDPQTSQRINEQVQPFSLLDVSNSDDDFLLDSSSEAYSLLDTKASAVDNQGDAIQGEEQIKQSNLIELQRSKKSGKCNLRKSLAWDSAFFTSAGVLEPEELSSIIEEAVVGVQKKPFLPRIEEDISKSSDSISTFESDLTLESIEADLFSDIRASIQRCTKSSTQENKESTIHGGGSINRSSPKIAETSSGNTAKSKLPSKKLNSVVQSSLKSSLKPNCVSKQATKAAVRSKESSSSLPRRPVAAVAIKRMSIGAGRAKSESNTAGNLQAGKAAPLHKASLQAKKTSPKQVAKSTLPSMCSSRSSCDSSSSSSSDITHKTRTDVRKKMENNSNLPLVSKTRLPSRVAVRNKPQSGNSNLSNYLKSTAKPSASISSTSSMSEWSIESCSSTATVELKNISMKPGSCSKDLDVSKSVGQNPARSGLAKPSGLRMPSAKIGFFDGVKAGTKTPVPTPRSHSTVTNTLPRSTTRISAPSGSVNKTKLEKTSAKVSPTTARTADLSEQMNKCEVVNDGNQRSSLEVGEVRDFKVVDSQACDDACAKDRVDEKVKCMEVIASKSEKNKKEDCDPLKPLCDDDDKQKRTPFAVKNIRPDVIDSCGLLLSDSAVDMVTKDDVMPCQREAEKENI